MKQHMALFKGTPSADVLKGSAEADVLQGGKGNDIYYVNHANDVVQEAEAEGNDKVISSLSYSLSGTYVEQLQLDGTASINATGNDLNNVLTGNDGNNILNGGLGADILQGGKGNDTYYVDDKADRVIEDAGQGVDKIYSSVSYQLYGTFVEQLQLTGKAHINATGNKLDNVLVGNDGHNLIDGGKGADMLQGGKGDDTYYVDNVADQVLEARGEGFDTVFSTISFALGSAHVELLHLKGSANINASGNSLDNILLGNAGNNVLNGGRGADLMRGGAGNDVYIVDHVNDLVNEAMPPSDYEQGDLMRVNTNSDGQQAERSNNTYTGYMDHSDFSPDGSKVIFDSFSASLVAGDTNRSFDVLVKDLKTGELVRVSTTSTDAQANDTSTRGHISADGNKVVFTSYATNLVSGEKNSWSDVFVKDLNTGKVTTVSSTSAGQPGDMSSYGGVLSPDGSKVLFNSGARNLVTKTTDYNYDHLFVKDLTNGKVTLITTNKAGQQANDSSGLDAHFSRDGTKVLFEGYASNLVADDNNNKYEVFVKDLNTGDVIRVATDSQGQAGNDISFMGYHSGFSADGSKVVFTSRATNLVPGDSNGEDDIFVKNLITGELTRVSSGITGEQANGSSDAASFSPDGSKVVFSSAASNLVAGDSNQVKDIFIKDLLTGEIVRANINLQGEQSNGQSYLSRFSPDSTHILFESEGSNLVVGDSNQMRDIFVRRVPTESDTGGIDSVKASISYALPKFIEHLSLTGSAHINATGNTLDNSLTGNTGNNVLRGGFGADRLAGGAGHDVLDGGAGKDTLLGGAGSDTAVFRLLAGADARGGNSADSWLDFRVGDVHVNASADKIDISELLIGYTGNGSASSLAAYVRLEQVGENSVLKVNRDGAGTTFGFSTVLNLHQVKVDLSTLLDNHQLIV